MNILELTPGLIYHNTCIFGVFDAYVVKTDNTVSLLTRFGWYRYDIQSNLIQKEAITKGLNPAVHNDGWVEGPAEPSQTIPGTSIRTPQEAFKFTDL
jgi:hypothetical protein